MWGMPYREPAENEEAKHDAAELAAFTRAADTSRKRVRWLAAGLAAVSLGGAVFVAWLAASTSSAPPETAPPGCHWANRKYLDHDSEKTEHYLDCPGRRPPWLDGPTAGR
jgi:hypothetical protein